MHSYNIIRARGEDSRTSATASAAAMHSANRRASIFPPALSSLPVEKDREAGLTGIRLQN